VQPLLWLQSPQEDLEKPPLQQKILVALSALEAVPVLPTLELKVLVGELE
jgi:hypothetical protein